MPRTIETPYVHNPADDIIKALGLYKTLTGIQSDRSQTEKEKKIQSLIDTQDYDKLMALDPTKASHYQQVKEMSFLKSEEAQQLFPKLMNDEKAMETYMTNAPQFTERYIQAVDAQQENLKRQGNQEIEKNNKEILQLSYMNDKERKDYAYEQIKKYPNVNDPKRQQYLTFYNTSPEERTTLIERGLNYAYDSGHLERPPDTSTTFMKEAKAYGLTNVEAKEAWLAKLAGQQIISETEHQDGTKTRVLIGGRVGAKEAGDMTTTTQGKLEQGVVSLEKSLATINKIESIPDEKIQSALGPTGNLAVPVLNLAERYFGMSLSKESKKSIGDTQNLGTLATKLSQDLRRETTGLAFSIKEMKENEKTYPNMNMGYTRFKESLKTTKWLVRKDLFIQKQLLQDGISPGTPAFKKQGESMWASKDSDSALKLFDSGEQSGMDANEIYNSLVQDGYDQSKIQPIIDALKTNATSR